MSSTVKVRQKYQITIPQTVRGAVPLKVGERVEVSARGREIVIRPIVEIPRHQTWALTKEWQDQLAQSLRDLEKGKVRVFRSLKEAKRRLGD
jgi:AbrB family looped-hinge helix DNA binding protein